jgi:hypothetical protein
VLVAHACNPSYSEARDQEDGGSKPAQANSSPDPILKIPNTKRVGGVAQSEGPEFKPQYHKKKKNIVLIFCSRAHSTSHLGHHKEPKKSR